MAGCRRRGRLDGGGNDWNRRGLGDSGSDVLDTGGDGVVVSVNEYVNVFIHVLSDMNDLSDDGGLGTNSQENKRSVKFHFKESRECEMKSREGVYKRSTALAYIMTDFLLTDV